LIAPAALHRGLTTSANHDYFALLVRHAGEESEIRWKRARARISAARVVELRRRRRQIEPTLEQRVNFAAEMGAGWGDRHVLGMLSQPASQETERCRRNAEISGSLRSGRRCSDEVKRRMRVVDYQIQPALSRGCAK